MFRAMVSKLLIALMLIPTLALADPIVTGSKPFTFIPGTVISSSQVNADFDYIINQVNTNAAKNGANSSITSLLGLTTPIAPAFGGSATYVATTVGGTVDAITITATTPAISSFSLTTGVSVTFVPTGTNTIISPTLNVNGTGAVIINKNTTGASTDLRPGELTSGQVVTLYYNGSRWVREANPRIFGGVTTIASASTTNLSAAPGHLVNVTGTTTITSFGGSGTASADEPIYIVRFAEALTITYNASSMITPSGGDISSTTGGVAVVEYLGSGNWRILSFDPAINTANMESVSGLTITNNAGTPNTQLDITKTKAILCNTTDFCVRTGNASTTINAAVTGINGLDTGALANNTWYYVYLIHTGAVSAGLLSTSATAPTMPAGYTFKYRIGAFRTGGAATFHRMRIRGNRGQYTPVSGSVTTVFPVFLTPGVGGFPQTVTVNGFWPPTANAVQGVISTASTTAHIATVASNNFIPMVSLQAGTSNTTIQTMFDIVVEGASIFAGSTGGNTSHTATGWTDSVNAN